MMSDEELLKLARDELSYDPDTGEFRWLNVRRGVRHGEIAGWVDERGYVRIQLNKKSYRAHRLAWLLMKGELPSPPNDQIDHINGNTADNRFCNLRKASNQQNTMNCRAKKTTAHGIKGVWLDARRNRWIARIMLQGRSKYLGSFQSAEDAHRAYCVAANQLFGKFARHG
jgi:hypothetical protein